MERLAIELPLVIRAVHHAAVEGAMMNSEHVARFMRQDFTTPQKQEAAPVFGRFRVVEADIETRKTVDPDAVAKRGLPEEEVPLRSTIEILQRDAQPGIGVAWQLPPE